MSEQPTDRLIDETLERNAEEVRRRFGTKPNDRLTAMLIPRSTGMFATLSSKLLLLGGSTLLVGGTLFFTASERIAVDSPVKPATPAPEAQSRIAPAPAAVPATTSVTAEPGAMKEDRVTPTAAHPATTLTDRAPSSPAVDPSARTPMTLDENGPITVSTDPHINPPVK